MVNYEQSLIYKICCKNLDIKDIYIGSTTNFKTRKSVHKTYCNKKKDIKIYNFINENGGWDNWEMVLIKKLNVNCRKELLAEERKVYEELKPSLNMICPGVNKKEADKKYYEKNKDKAKEYREKTKEHRAKVYKEWSLKNKEKLKQRRREYYQKHKK